MNIPTPRFTAAMIRLSPWPFGSYSLARILTFLAPFAVVLIEQQFFNTFGMPVQHTMVWWFLGAYAAVSMVRLACLLGECWTNITFRYRAMGALQRNTVASALRQPGAQPQAVLPLELLNRLRDDAGEVADFPLWLPEVVGTTITTTCALVLMWRVDAGLTLLAITPLVLQGLAALGFWRIYLRYRYEAGHLDDAYSTLIGTIIATAQSIRLLALQSEFVGQVEALGTRRRRNAIGQNAYEHLSARSMVDVSVAVASALCLWYVVPAVATLQVGVGDLFVFFSGLSIVAALPQTWATFVGDYAQQHVSIERLTDAQSGNPLALIQEPPIQAAGRTQAFPHEPLTALDVRGVSYQHADGRGVTDLSFTLPRGSLTVVTGRIGSGKTTLLTLCAGLLTPESGTFGWNTQSLRTMQGAAVVSVPQRPFLFSASLRDNICLGHDPAHLPYAVQASMLSADIARMPDGLDTLVGPRGMRVSGGQRQRVALARALLRTAELLVLDDISSALDNTTEAALLQNLRQHQSGTILASSTRPAVLAAADTILVLAEGRIVGVGTLTELLHTNAWMQELWADVLHPQGIDASPIE